MQETTNTYKYIDFTKFPEFVKITSKKTYRWPEKTITSTLNSCIARTPKHPISSLEEDNITVESVVNVIKYLYHNGFEDLKALPEFKKKKQFLIKINHLDIFQMPDSMKKYVSKFRLLSCEEKRKIIDSL